MLSLLSTAKPLDCIRALLSRSTRSSLPAASPRPRPWPSQESESSGTCASYTPFSPWFFPGSVTNTSVNTANWNRAELRTDWLSVMAAIQSPSENLSINGSKGWAVRSFDRSITSPMFSNSPNPQVTVSCPMLRNFLLGFHRDMS